MASTLSLYAMPGAFASTFLHFFASCSLFVHLAIYLHNQRVFLPQFAVHTETDSAKSMNGAHPLASPCPLKQLWVLTCNKTTAPVKSRLFGFPAISALDLTACRKVGILILPALTAHPLLFYGNAAPHSGSGMTSRSFSPKIRRKGRYAWPILRKSSINCAVFLPPPAFTRL